MTREHHPTQPSADRQYAECLRRTRSGRLSGNRTDTKTVKTRGERMVFDLSGGHVSVLTTKSIAMKPLVGELLWFLAGDTSNATLRKQGIRIWNEWATTEEQALQQRPLDVKERCQLAAAMGKIPGPFAGAIVESKVGARLTSRYGRLPTDEEFHAELDTADVPRHGGADELGPIYGQQWRRFPAGDFFWTMKPCEVLTYIEHMAPDQRKELAAEFTYGEGENFETLLARAKDPEDNVAGHLIGNFKDGLTRIGIDQISLALYKLKVEPLSRQNIVTAWNPQVLPNFVTSDGKLTSQDNVFRGRAALPACHTFFQFLCDELTEAERLALVDYTDLQERGGYGLIDLVNLQKLYHLRVHDMTSENGHGDAAFVERHQAYAKKLYDDFGGNSALVGLSKADTFEGSSPSYYRPGKIQGDYYFTRGDVPTGVMLDLLGVPRHRLHMVMFQRSGDLFLGVPFNIASYSILARMFAAQANMAPGELTWFCGDCHLYVNHLDQVDLQLSREPKAQPTLWLNPEVKSIFEYTLDDIVLKDYDPHPAIKAAVAV